MEGRHRRLGIVGQAIYSDCNSGLHGRCKYGSDCAFAHDEHSLASVVHILIILHSWVIRKLGLPSWGPRCQDQDSKLHTVERDTYSESEWWRAVQMKALYVTFPWEEPYLESAQKHHHRRRFQQQHWKQWQLSRTLHWRSELQSAPDLRKTRLCCDLSQSSTCGRLSSCLATF